MKSEYENFIKINEFNKSRLRIKEEDEEDSEEISVGFEEKLFGNLIPNDDKIEIGNCFIIFTFSNFKIRDQAK